MVKSRTVLGAAMAAALALALAPASAFALGNDAKWIAPDEKTATTVAAGEGETQSYITSSAHKVTESAADILGISNITVFPNAGNPFTYTGETSAIFDSISTNARFGIYGTDVNQNKNPWYANYFYNAAQAASGGTDFADARDTILISTTASGGPNAADAQVVDAYGTSSALYYRPDMLYGVGSVTSKITGKVKAYGDALTTTSGYSALVDKIRNKELGSYDGEDLYQDGDENYDPYYVNYSMTNGAYGSVDNLYSLANAAEAIMADDSSKTTRYEDPLEIAQKYESYLLGTQYAVLKAIAGGDVERKTVAVISKVDAETHSITLIDDAADKATSTGNQLLDGIEATTDNIIDVNKLTDLTAQAKDIMACDVVYIDGYNGMTTNVGAAQIAVAEQLKTVLAAAGFADESAYPEIYIVGPKTVIHNTRAGSPECTPAAISALGFAYPTVINPVHALAYFYENFYHVKDSRLADALGLNIAAMSTPAGVDLDIEGYSNDAFQAVIDDGLAYYYENANTVKASYPKLEASKSIASLVKSAGLTKQAADAQAGAASDVSQAQEAQKAAEGKLAEAQEAQRVAEGKLAEAEQKAEQAAAAAQGSSSDAQQAKKEAEAAKAEAAKAIAALTTVTLNKSTVKASDVKAYPNATTVVLGTKVKKISADAFKGSKVKTLIVQTKKLKKAKVKNCLKGSKVKTVQLPSSKVKAYKKIFTKKAAGKKVKFA